MGIRQNTFNCAWIVQDVRQININTVHPGSQATVFLSQSVGNDLCTGDACGVFIDVTIGKGDVDHGHIGASGNPYGVKSALSMPRRVVCVQPLFSPLDVKVVTQPRRGLGKNGDGGV